MKNIGGGIRGRFGGNFWLLDTGEGATSFGRIAAALIIDSLRIGVVAIFAGRINHRPAVCGVREM